MMNKLELFEYRDITDEYLNWIDERPGELKTLMELIIYKEVSND